MRLESQEDLKRLEAALAEFVNDPRCPKLVAEEFLESQEEEEKPAGIFVHMHGMLYRTRGSGVAGKFEGSKVEHEWLSTPTMHVYALLFQTKTTKITYLQPTSRTTFTSNQKISLKTTSRMSGCSS
jgi:hypothetical protein